MRRSLSLLALSKKFSREPKIGVALGSGGARGWAHIGVLRILEKHGIHPTIIAGCSFGAAVGASYAAGTLNELETYARSIKWTDYVEFVDFNWTKNISGFLLGDKIMRRLEPFFPGDIAMLPKTFGCVATNLRTGKEIWIKNGSTSQAVRSSMSLPGLFTPVKSSLVPAHHNHSQDDWLVDGGLVNPVPVTLCRALGADIVIAVNLNADLIARNFMKPPPKDKNKKSFDQILLEALLYPLPGPWHSTATNLSDRLFKKTNQGVEQAPNIMKVLSSCLNIMQHHITTNRMLGDPPEIELSPQLLHADTFDLEKAAKIIIEGEICAEKEIERIKNIISVFE